MEHRKPTAPAPEQVYRSPARDQRPPQAPFELTVARSLDAPPLARAALGRWLAAEHCPRDLADDLILVVSELVTHAASAAYVTATIGEDQLRLEVHDESPARHANGTTICPAASDSGS